jgi:hypothetical protein
MPTLQHKLKTYFRNKNDNLARELATELYILLYKSNNGSPISFGGVVIDFVQTQNSIDADILKIYLALKTSNTPVEV